MTAAGCGGGSAVDNAGGSTEADGGATSTPIDDDDTSAVDSTASDTGSDTGSDTDDPPQCPSCIVLPIEVLAAEPVTKEVEIAFAGDPAAVKTLSLRVHGLSYQAMASVQVDDGAWIDLRNDTVEVVGPGKTFGGIGGGFATLELRVDLPDGAVEAGDFTLRLRYNGTDGRSLGYRVLSIDLLDARGQSLLDLTQFRLDDPAQWTAPSSDAATIAAGKALWQSATLERSPLVDTVIKATCSDCHAVDARDLEYFAFSNLSIIERARHHGLSQADGEAIASYVRSLGLPRVGRPWNPPFQPGPGLTQRPVAEWSAGAGVDAVLDDELGGRENLPGNGVDKAALIDGDHILPVDLHELPIALQLLDWNHWLPDIHPKEYLGDGFQDTNNWKLYQEIRAGLSGASEGGADEYKRTELRSRMDDWANSMTYTTGDAEGIYDLAMPNAVVTAQEFEQAYAAGAWNAVKLWELHQEFALEELGVQSFGVVGEPRSWLSNRHIFDVSPHIIHQLRSDQPFLEEVSTHGDADPLLMNTYLANTWYQLQLLLNPGHRKFTHGGHNTIDWGYMAGLFGDLDNARQRGEPMRRLLFFLESMATQDTGLGPEPERGPWWTWNLRDTNWAHLNLGDPRWQDVPQVNRVLDAALGAWSDKTGTFPVAQWKQTYGISYDGANIEPEAWIIGGGDAEQNDRSIADWMWGSLAPAKALGVHGSVLAALCNFGEAMWPNNDWNQFRRAQADLAAPVDLSALPGVESVALSWQATAGAASYSVLRATASDGPYLTRAVMIDGTNFVDTLLEPEATYFYKVTADDATLAGPFSAVVSVQPTHGLAARYDFDEDGDDVLDGGPANGRGKLLGGAQRTQGPGGRPAIELDGVTAFISVRNSLHRWLGRTATLAVWVKTSAVGNGVYFQNPGIAGVAGGGDDELYWGVIDHTGRIGINEVFSASPINDGVWHHVVLTRDHQTGAQQVFVDGLLSASGEGDPGVMTRRFHSLGRTDITPNYFEGSLAEVQIFDHVLDADEIAALAELE
ncbi:MAG: hypothetical protein IAG13_12955 [Deltaproteobacteria bacterium]|nr:hypothetical protein [Nannocystaceae bacterium]